MESIKTCNVCYLGYDTKDHAPRSLPCGHTICSSCLTGILNNPNLRKCPFDNIPFMPSPQNSLAFFPLTFVIMDLLEQRKNNTCRTHVDEKLKLICVTDQTKICSECAKHEYHKDHKIKKIKALKAQGAKVKRELQEALVKIKEYEQEKADDFEQIRKVFISAIDEQVKEVKNILAEKQFEWVQQVNHIFDADEKHDSESILGLKQQMSETIKNITHACQDENGDLMVLAKEENNNDKNIVKKLTEFLKEKSSRVKGKVFEMQKSLKEAFASCHTVMNSLQLSTQDVVKEIYSQSSQEEFIEVDKKLRSIKFMSHCDIGIDSGCLNISFKNTQQKELEINLDDFQAIKAIDIQLVRCDMLKNEPQPDVLSYIFHGLKKLVYLNASFEPQNFYNEGLLWLGNKVQNHVENLKGINLNLVNCKFDDESMQILCDMIFSKAKNLDSFALNLNSCQILDPDLEISVKSLKHVQKSLEIFALGLSDNKITSNGINQVFEFLKRMESLKELHLYLSRANITNESLTIFGEDVLPSLKGLENLALSFDKNEKISDEGFCVILKGLSNLKRLDLSLCGTQITDKAMEMFIGRVLPGLGSLEYLAFRSEGTLISKENLERIKQVSVALRRKEQVVKMEIERSRTQEIDPSFELEKDSC